MATQLVEVRAKLDVDIFDPSRCRTRSCASSASPIINANRGDAYDGPSISEEEHEVTLRAERPVVSTETEAVERVRLGTETVRGEETVSGEVRKEEIDDDVRVADRDRANTDRV